MARKISRPVSREQLLQAVGNTYDDARFLMGMATRLEENFLQGLCRHRCEFWSKVQLLEAIFESKQMEYSGVPNHDEHLLLSDRLYVCRSSINKAQIFPKMEDAEGYHHTAERGNPHYDIYFKFDHAAKTVTFALGGEKKVVPLEEYTGWSWKLTGTKLLCGTSFELEKTFLDEFWDVVPVNLGRKVLRIKDVI